jgi:hypothetical protein
MSEHGGTEQVLRSAILGALGIFAGIMLYHILDAETVGFFDTIITEHPAATIGLPLVAMGSLGVVLLLRSTTGPVEFEAIGFKFRGASGPIVMWIAVFLVIAIAIKMLW